MLVEKHGMKSFIWTPDFNSIMRQIWKEKENNNSEGKIINMGREENVVIFENTMQLCKENEILKTAIKNSQKNQQVILEGAEITKVDNTLYGEPATIIVSTKRTYEAASVYKGQKVAVHNFASASNPGGGVERGATAQEECLCRCSTLFPCLKMPELWEQFYKPHRAAHNPIHNDDIIYTLEIVVFKSDTANPKLLPEQDWYKVNVITCAAPNLRERPSNQYNSGDGNKAVKITDKALKEIHEKRLKRILDVAYQNGNEVVILGAFGCGAFANNPNVVAMAAKEVIKEYQYKFKTIEFAVYCSPRDDSNYRIFKRILEGSK